MTYTLHTDSGPKSLEANSHRQALEKVKVVELGLKPTAKLTRGNFAGAGLSKLVCGRTIVFPRRKKRKKPSIRKAHKKELFTNQSWDAKFRRRKGLRPFRAVA